MSFSPMLRHFRAVDVLVAIRAQVAEQYRPAPRAPQADPWWQADMNYLTAWAGVVAQIPA
ncbi:hypothetical protein GCM10010399_64040 [Dactylosporangium fulvum]|uniref:Uncharacterized protein n=1 Tax=Dactylosporangium fulvum TaxID=53359 RepID=A0ABY5W6Y8_9ACTN|nr:hypothetical protein [Dactylosporangium fulvum]UWP85773.1 hypothetical protein Dfulv_16635 [Dactylosporangium fulvum]